MTVFQPLLILAALFALIAAQSWWQVYGVADRHGSDASRVSRKIKLAAIWTVIVFVLASASVLLPSLAGMFVD